MRPIQLIVISFVIAFASICSAADVSEVRCGGCQQCQPRSIIFVPAQPLPPVYRLVPVSPRGAALARRRAAAPLAFPWLPGDAFRGRGQFFVPATQVAPQSQESKK